MLRRDLRKNCGYMMLMKAQTKLLLTALLHPDHFGRVVALLLAATMFLTALASVLSHF